MNTALIKQVIYRIGVGVVGAMILVAFLTGLMPLADAIGYLPWIIGFNAALTGYTIVDKTRDRLKRKRAVTFGSGAVMGAVVCLCINAVDLYLSGDFLLSAGDLIFLSIIGCALSGLGAWLAMKYLHLM